MSSRLRASSGFTLAGLLVSLALVAILASIAMPMYLSHSSRVEAGLIRDNIRSIHLLQVERRMSHGDYVSGIWLPGTGGTLGERLGWNPGPGQDRVTYRVTCDLDGGKPGECARSSGYQVTATHEDRPGSPIVMQFQ